MGWALWGWAEVCGLRAVAGLAGLGWAGLGGAEVVGVCGGGGCVGICGVLVGWAWCGWVGRWRG